MNKMLERAIAEVARLPDAEQERYGYLILEEFGAEQGWDERFAKSPGKLTNLVNQARRQIADGEVFSYDPSNRPAK